MTISFMECIKKDIFGGEFKQTLKIEINPYTNSILKLKVHL